ncbi:MAG TPA: hypothetical protein VGF21_10905, partial [Thermoleophilaceae bacterium]
FGVGMVHGVGGSAGIGILLVGAVSSGLGAAAALVLFALAAAASMSFVSATLGTALVRPRVRRRLAALVPLLGCCAVLFGAHYLIAAI